MSDPVRRRRPSASNDPNNKQLIASLVSELLQNKAPDTTVKTVAKNQELDQINLVALFWRLLSKWMYIAAAAIVAVSIAFVYLHFFFTPTYTATSKLYIIADSDSVINLSALQVGSQLSDDYTEVFKTWEVHEMVREELNLDYSYAEMQSMISVSNSSSSRVLYITATHKDPTMASDIANAYASAAKTFIASVMKTDEPSSFSMALVPSIPSGTSKTKIIVIAFLFGTALAAGIVILQFFLDDRPKTPDDITEISTLSVLGIIPASDSRKLKGRQHELR